MTASDFDLKMMRRCIELSAIAAREGELPFAALVCRGEDIVSEATNRVMREGDATRHAELIAVSEAQRTLGRKTLANCTIYSNVEPCAMCSFPIRETRIGRVVYALRSPMMGGFSKWNVLGDKEISHTLPEIFGGVPEVVAGMMHREAAEVWRNWNPLIWEMISRRGYFQEPSTEDDDRQIQAASRRLGILRSLLNSRLSFATIWHAIRLRFG